MNRYKNKDYVIVTNERGRRILILNKLIDIEKDDRVGFDDFDALFLNIRFFSHHEVSYSLQRISPFYSDKCWIKPRFYVSQMNETLKREEYLVDGYAENPHDNGITRRIEEIYDNMERLGISYNHDRLQHTHASLCLRLCKYTFVRGVFDFTATVVPGMARGFTALFVSLFDKLAMDTRIEILRFIQKLLALNYVRRRKFVERVHLCPDCHRSHLVFIECCPKCQSSHLTEESVIHHFRCANVSPESTYLHDGELLCPKCKKYLRHIGVDYDRPTDIYMCHNCNNTFLHSIMKVYCTNCNKYHKVGELYSFDVWEFEFTEEGIRSITGEGIKMQLAQDIWNGYIDYESYIGLFDWFLGTLSADESVLVLRIQIADADMTENDRDAFFQDVYVRFYYYNLTRKRDYIYLTQRCRSGNVNVNRSKMEKEVSSSIAEFSRRYSTKAVLEERIFVYNAGDDMNAFIKKVDLTVDE